MELDPEVQDLMRQLAAAIDDAIRESVPIADAIKALRDAGYEITMVLEATIGYRKRGESAKPAAESGKPTFTSQDERFMRSLKISLDEPEDPSKS